VDRLGVRGLGALFVDCYSPRESDVCSDVGRAEAEGSWLATDRPDDQVEVPRSVDEEILGAGDGSPTIEQALATGVARPSKSRGFGRQKVYQDPDDASPEVKRLAMRPGTHMLKQGPSWPKGALSSDVEAAWQDVVAKGADRTAGPKLRTTYRRKNGVWSCDEWRIDWTALEEPRDMVREGPCDVMVCLFEPEEVTEETESIRKAGHYTYKNEGKARDQTTLFSELEKEIAKRKEALMAGLLWPDKKARESSSFRAAMKAACDKNGKYLIGGKPGERKTFFDKALGTFPNCFWLEGCAAPTVRDYVIEFTAKPGAKPVARQPIPLSPYDEMRVEYRISLVGTREVEEVGHLEGRLT